MEEEEEERERRKKKKTYVMTKNILIFRHAISKIYSNILVNMSRAAHMLNSV